MSEVEKKLSGKRILLLYGHFFGYDLIVKNKLEEMGAKVDLYDARANINAFEKAIKKIYSKYYYRKQKKFHKKIQIENSESKYDFIFLNVNMEVETLINYKEVFPEAKLILYLDDSVKNAKNVEKTFEYYDRVISFDRLDSINYNIEFRPLFFCDSFKNLKESKKDIKYDLCFIGTCHSDRLKIIDKIIDSKFFKTSYMYCYLQSWFMYYYHYIFENKIYGGKSFKFFKYKQLKMDEVAEKMAESNVILDIQHPKQTGLTMRTIETLGLGKKFITTNKDIENYDFYNPNNILIIDRENPKISSEFVKGEYLQLDEELYKKYSLQGWIEDVFK